MTSYRITLNGVNMATLDQETWDALEANYRVSDFYDADDYEAGLRKFLEYNLRSWF